ncbi:MAG: aminotransferase class I/II-fold pyridoxal phosphate-dependent enzyme [bacterium]|nr:aminotransferase class I/II-fold pyridoxal phosphate-dependent enzyme [bacterium]
MNRLSTYSPPQPAGEIQLDLSRNEGRPPAPNTVDAARARAAELARYPVLDELQRTLAANYDVAPTNVLITAGIDDALLRICLANLGPKTNAVLATPTFEMIPRYIALARGDVAEVEWNTSEFPTTRFCEAITATTRVAFVVSPNNPTGSTATADDLRRIAAALPDGLVVLDAAYGEFGDAGQRALIRLGIGLPNVLVLRTLSKAWGLAGLRVGCAIGAPDQLRTLFAAGNPMPVSVASAHTAVCRLTRGTLDVQDHVAAVDEQRRELTALLTELGTRPVTPSQANFVLVRGVDPVWLTTALAALGIGVRRFPNDPTLADAVRIGLPGTDQAFRQLTAALRTVLAPQALLFDMDGVLADVSQSYRQAIVATAATFGVTVSPADIVAKKARGNANDDWQLTRELLLDANVTIELPRVTDTFETLYSDLRHNERPMVDGQTLRRWGQRYRLAVVTGRPRSDAEFFLRQFGLRDLFAAVICREDAPLKPDPRPVQRALDALGATSAWMLGDTVDDHEAARGAGVLPIAVGPPDDRAAINLTATPELESILP